MTDDRNTQPDHPAHIYDQSSFDERIERLYQNEAIMAQRFKIFSFLAILISCLGLYGLVSFMAVQKTKEAGIRKVPGCICYKSCLSVLQRIYHSHSCCIRLAAPLAYYFINNRLSGSYYHTNIGVSVFFLAVIGSVLIAWMTVGYKALKQRW